jgi:hypothetical protein
MFTKLSNIAKIVSTIIGAIVVTVSSLWGVYSFLSKNAVQKATDDINKQAIEQKVDHLIKSDSEKTVKLDVVICNQEASMKITNALNTSYKIHLKESKKVDELIQYLEMQKEDEKKNNNYLTPVPIPEWIK